MALIRGTFSKMILDFFGLTWTLVFTPRKRGKGKKPPKDPHHGACDAPWLPDRKIYVRRGLKPQDELETFCHEFLHAMDWSKSEEWVEKAGEDFAKALWKLGYRRNPRG